LSDTGKLLFHSGAESTCRSGRAVGCGYVG
jgi:hypothetical protein